MEIMSANAEQIAQFKTAAAARYQELGVKPELADQLFNAQLEKLSCELGVTGPADKDAKCKADKKQKDKKAAIDKLASNVAKSLGRERKQ